MKDRKADAAQKKTTPAPGHASGSIVKKTFNRENIEAIVIAVVLALAIRNFVVQAFKIPSGSMEHTLEIGDHILVNKFMYGISNQIQIPLIPDITYTEKKFLQITKPERGDVVVFMYPVDESKDFIKRIIAVEGDTVEIRQKKVYLNGSPVDDPHAQFADSAIYNGPDAAARQRDNFGPKTVPPGHIFVMGDNRDRSLDSRFWGFVDINKVRGKAWRIYWSWDSFINNIRWRRLGQLIQ
jgi:signal peptidase I